MVVGASLVVDPLVVSGRVCPVLVVVGSSLVVVVVGSQISAHNDPIYIII